MFGVDAVVALWALTVFGVEMGALRAAAGSPTVFLLALHSWEYVYAVYIYAKVALCNSLVVVLVWHRHRRCGLAVS